MHMNTESRLPYLKSEVMNAKQREFYDFHINKFQNMPYIWKLDGGELNGPSNAMLHDIEIGDLLFRLNREIVGQTRIGRDLHEIAVLVVVTSGKAAYGTYAHEELARKAGVAEDKICAIVAGQRPGNLTEEEAATYDMAFSLCQAGPIAGSVYDRAMRCFGKDGVAIIVWLVGMFKLIGTILNAYNEPVPDYRDK